MITFQLKTSPSNLVAGQFRRLAFCLLLAVVIGFFTDAGAIEPLRVLLLALVPTKTCFLLGLVAAAGFPFWINFVTSAVQRLGFVIHESLISEISDLNWKSIPAIAAASGFCEEIIFRGLVQYFCGFWVACIGFGLVHFEGRTNAAVYCVVTGFVGAYLSAAYTLTGSLWVPIIAHATNNFVALCAERYRRTHAGW